MFVHLCNTVKAYIILIRITPNSVLVLIINLLIFISLLNIIYLFI